ncbi:hypothetical protein B484DRAFT_392643, partial [Ochromonadaceae sp. CCMP2298]
LREREEFANKQKEATAKAYGAWVLQKDMRDLAVKCLLLVPKPIAPDCPQHDDPRVDRTTFADWSRWADGIFSPNTAAILWDAFPPKACDVHCAAYSQIRDTFLKLLRPGLGTLPDT